MSVISDTEVFFDILEELFYPCVFGYQGREVGQRPQDYRKAEGYKYAFPHCLSCPWGVFNGLCKYAVAEGGNMSNISCAESISAANKQHMLKWSQLPC